MGQPIMIRGAGRAAKAVQAAQTTETAGDRRNGPPRVRGLRRPGHSLRGRLPGETDMKPRKRKWAGARLVLGLSLVAGCNHIGPHHDDDFAYHAAIPPEPAPVVAGKPAAPEKSAYA